MRAWTIAIWEKPGRIAAASRWILWSFAWAAVAIAVLACTFPETAVLRFKFEQPIIGDEVEDVSILWEIDALAVKDGDGAVTVKPKEADAEHQRVCGYTRDRLRPWDCTPIVFGCQFCADGADLDADTRAACLAHEVGHVAGLDHHDDADNVMFFRTAGDTTETTEDQRTAVRGRAAWLELCP